MPIVYSFYSCGVFDNRGGGKRDIKFIFSVKNECVKGIPLTL